MNRKLLTGLTLASVAGTGGAAYVAVATPADPVPAAVFASPLVTAADTSTSAATATSAITTTTTTTTAAVGRTISYQVGDAGTVTVDVAGSQLTSRGLVPASGWNVGAMSSSGSHLDVQFANTERVVGFSADLVGADVVVSVTNDRRPGAPGPIDPLVVAVIGGSDAPAGMPAPATAPSFDSVVPAAPAPAPVFAPTPVAPSASSTSSPSSPGTYDDDHDDHDEQNEHDDDQNEHDDEYENSSGSSSSHSDDSEGGDDD